jgi:hypothetical protein
VISSPARRYSLMGRSWSSVIPPPVGRNMSEPTAVTSHGRHRFARHYGDRSRDAPCAFHATEPSLLECCFARELRKRRRVHLSRLPVVQGGRAGLDRRRARSRLNAGAAGCPFDAPSPGISSGGSCGTLHALRRPDARPVREKCGNGFPLRHPVRRKGCRSLAIPPAWLLPVHFTCAPKTTVRVAWRLRPRCRAPGAAGGCVIRAVNGCAAVAMVAGLAHGDR